MIDDYHQPAGGYRFSEDSLLLAREAPMALAGRAVDLGAGCGVAGLEALAAGRLRGLAELVLVEADEAFQESLALNVARLKALDPSLPAVRIIRADWRGLRSEDLGGGLQLALANPPYVQAGRGRPPAPGRRAARMEGPGGLEGFLDACSRLLAVGGRLLMSWPRRRLAELVRSAAERSLHPARLSMPPRRGAPLVLVELAAPAPAAAGRPVDASRVGGP